jgi:hypothetical protein
MYRLMFSGVSNPTNRPSSKTGKLTAFSPNISSYTPATFACGVTTNTSRCITSLTATSLP